ncbi:hypothetical protein SAMN04489712_102199 [Thermomonospora echinospora]|uniref:Lipoprotein n=1 Tax=Thermomonospora echinospora TaxID=1992 RepID=A0A1H5V7M6_9ACTN|nr:hypothetical protein [Thermomonospora echinospora]SEF83213.1 hypothetical protein SAMN04489712_102199 [Thermomonospora echinospora]
MFPRGLAALLLGAGAVTACATGGDPAPPPAPIPTAPPGTSAPPVPTVSPGPSAPGGLVLRWRLTGGIAGVGGPGALPDFSLYGDGRALVPAGGSPLEVREYRLTGDALRRLLDGARTAGLDRGRTVERPRIADAFTLVIRFGSARTRIEHPEEDGDPAVRFWKRLDPRGWPRQDQAVPPRPHRYTRLAVLAGEVTGGTGGPVRRWPLSPLGRGEQAGGGLCTVLDGDDAATATRLGKAAPAGTLWRSEGKVYSVRWRPLLPDESTCRDMAAG